MTEPSIIETRSRSRSKTPAVTLTNLNGDSDKKGSKKIPPISEETSQSQKPKRQRKSVRPESPKTSQQVEVTNGANEIDELNQSFIGNFISAIKTSTPIFSSKKSSRVTRQTKVIDIMQHPAYKEYKEAGEYWNKYPKTDYTYSELSPHRRELGEGIVAMPNMSRRSLDKFTARVENMIEQNPQDETLIRRKFLRNSQKLQSDSGDEIDSAIIRRRSHIEMNIVQKFFMSFVTFFSSIYSSVRGATGRIFYRKASGYNYTPVRRYREEGIFHRLSTSLLRFFLFGVSKIYLLISSVLCFDTWLLFSRNDQVYGENKKRKRFLLALLLLLPFLLLGAFLLSDDNENFLTTRNLFASNLVEKSQDFLHQSYASLPSFNLPSIPLPHFQLPSINFAYLFTPLVTLGVATREFIFGSPQAREQLKMVLDEEKFQMLLQHIDAYIDNSIGEKFLTPDGGEKMKAVNDRLILIISSNINEALKTFEHQLTPKEIDKIILDIRGQLNEDLDDREKILLGRISMEKEETMRKISANVVGQKIDLDSVVAAILGSEKLFGIVDGRLKPLIARLDIHDQEIANIKLHLDRFKVEVLQKFTKSGEDLEMLKNDQKLFADALLKHENILKSFEGKFATLTSSSIDASVRKNILNIFGGSNEAMSEGDIKSWIASTFVAKNFLEERLKSLQLNSDKIFQLQLDKNAGILMDEVGKEIKAQIGVLGSSRGTAGGSLTEDDVLRIVKKVLAIYDADKTGLVDYALESAGGEIISTRCTENYRTRHAEISIFGIPVWYPSNTPRTVIAPSIAPGECWAWTGFPGFLVVKLNNFIQVTGFTVEHIPQSLAPNGNIDSAPNNFTVWGLTSEHDHDPVLFGTYHYSSAKDAPSLQHFPVQNKEISLPYQFIELRVESNHGNPKYTCLYRFRVHGNMRK